MIWPTAILALMTLTMIGFQYVVPIFPYLTDSLCILTYGKIPVEFWSLVLSSLFLIAPIFVTALIMRTFCRYIHERRRPLSKTHFISSFFYIFSVIEILLFLSIFTYSSLVFCNNPGNLIFFITKEKLNVPSTIFYVNIILTISLSINSVLYIISTYIIESIEMKKINGIQDLYILMLESTHISKNFFLVINVLSVYSAITFIFTVLLYFLLETFAQLLQQLTLSFFISAIAHIFFAVGYMSYTNVSFKVFQLSNEEKSH